MKKMIFSAAALLVWGAVSASDGVRSSSDVQIHDGASASTATDGSTYYWTEVRHNGSGSSERHNHSGSGGRVTLECASGTRLGSACHAKPSGGGGSPTATIERQDGTGIRCRDHSPNDDSNYFTVMLTCSGGGINVSTP